MIPLSKMERRLLVLFSGPRQTFSVHYCPCEWNPGTFSASDYRAVVRRLHHRVLDLKAELLKEILWPHPSHKEPLYTLLSTLDPKSLDCVAHESFSVFSWQRRLKK